MDYPTITPGYTEPTDAEIAALKEKHGPLHQFTTSSGATVICRAANQADHKMFRAKVDDPKKKLQAGPDLFRGCLVWPEWERFTELLSTQPFLIDTFASDLIEVSGLDNKTEKKVL